mgnify:CR=1 FL=1
MVPAKFEPEATTTVPAGPEGGFSVKLGGAGTLNDAMPMSPVVPVTVTEYVPLASGATVNDPDTTPPATVQTGLDMRGGEEGDDEIVQPVSPAAKPDPVTKTFVPAGPEGGKSVIGSVLKKSADTEPSELGNVTVYGPVAAAAATVKLPVIWKVAPEILHETPDSRPGGELNKVAAQPKPASAALKPDPEMETDARD